MTVVFGCDVRRMQDCWQKVRFSANICHVHCSLKWKKYVLLRQSFFFLNIRFYDFFRNMHKQAWLKKTFPCNKLSHEDMN